MSRRALRHRVDSSRQGLIVAGQDFSTTGVKEGDLLAAKYRIDKILGAGGMGVVVAAHHIHLDERVAIKFLLPDALSNPEAVTRFAREGRAAVKIKSEHVARVSDVGTLENGAPYMVMEYLEGEDLTEWLRRRGPLPVEQAVEFVLQASEAVAEAHAMGIVHRDLKPANLFVVKRPDGAYSVKVLDFGISKVTGLGSSGPDLGMTKTTAVMGSPLYMSPEQMQSSKDVDPRADIWALGVILYELITGTTAFEAETMPELVVKILQAPPAPLRNKRPDAPPGLERVILRCLEKDRGRRYTTVGELARDLGEFAPKRARLSIERISGVLQAAGLSASALDMPPSSEAPPAPPGAGTMAAWGKTGSTPNGRRAIYGVIGAVALALVLLGILLGRSSGNKEAPPAVAASELVAVVPPPAEPAVAPAPSPSPPPPVAPAQPTVAPIPAPTAAPVVATPPAPAAPPKALVPGSAHKTAAKPAAAPAPPASPAKAKADHPSTPAPMAPSNAFDDRK